MTPEEAENQLLREECWRLRLDNDRLVRLCKGLSEAFRERSIQYFELKEKLCLQRSRDTN